jgi:hypothetical protein
MPRGILKSPFKIKKRRNFPALKIKCYESRQKVQFVWQTYDILHAQIVFSTSYMTCFGRISIVRISFNCTHPLETNRKGVSRMVITADHVIAFCTFFTLIIVLIDWNGKK